MTTRFANGAPVAAVPNLSRPRTKRTSASWARAWSWNDLVSAGRPFDPEKLKWFRTHYLVRFTHDEDGNALDATPHLTTAVFDEGEIDGPVAA